MWDAEFKLPSLGTERDVTSSRSSVFFRTGTSDMMREVFVGGTGTRLRSQLHFWAACESNLLESRWAELLSAFALHEPGSVVVSLLTILSVIGPPACSVLFTSKSDFRLQGFLSGFTPGGPPPFVASPRRWRRSARGSHRSLAGTSADKELRTSPRRHRPKSVGCS